MIATGLFRSLHSRSFALLWTGQTISRLGDSLYTVALAWWVLETTGSAVAMGTVLICTMTPMLIFLLFGGVMVDRLPRIRLMLASDLLSGAVVGVIALLAFAGELQVWHVYIASAIFGFVSAFFEPAYQAVIPDITPQESLSSANSLTVLSGRLVAIGGPALAASMVALGGTSLAFALNALSFFVSAALIAPLPELPVAQSSERQHVLGDIQAGFAAILAQPWLWLTIVIASLGNIILGAPFSVALPFLVDQTLGGDVGTLGLLLSCSAAGSVLCALLLGQRTSLRRRGLLAYGALIVGSLMLMLIGLVPLVPVIAMAVLIKGAMMTLFGLVWVNTLQQMVPRDLMSRVVSVDMLGSFALLPVGYGLIGWLTDWTSAAMVFSLCGVIAVLVHTLSLLHPAIRTLD